MKELEYYTPKNNNKNTLLLNIDINKLEKEIKDYKANFFSSWNDEKYKWEAVSWFQSHWDIKSPDFTQMLETSLSKTQNLHRSTTLFS